MNDYKELIDNLRSNQNNTFQLEAADAIEQLSTKCRQLEKERDAIYADMKTMCTTVSSVCDFCKNNGENICEKCNCTDWFDHWEWRGVQEASE